jgi:hypothetical protein
MQDRRNQISHRGLYIDMEALRKENEHVPAVGNMSVNARGDQIKGGKVTKTADELARENHRIQTAVVSNASLKPVDKEQSVALEQDFTKKPKVATRKVKETEADNGDIIVGDEE